MRFGTGRRVIRRSIGLAGGVFVAVSALATQAGAANTGAATPSAHSGTMAATSAAVNRTASISGASATAGPATCPPGYLVTHDANPPPTTPPHIMEIMMENTAYSANDGSPYVIGNPKAPYKHQ